MSQKTTRTSDYLSINALEITLTWPFQIGNPLDFRQTKTEKYEEKQKNVKKKMKKLFCQYRWEIPEYGRGQKYATDSGGTGKAYSPPYYLKCSINCHKIKHSIQIYNFLIEKIKIKFYEFGFATISLSCTISPKFSFKGDEHIICTSDFLRILDEFDDEIVNNKVEEVKELVSTITNEFNSAIKESKILEFFKKEKILDEAICNNTNNVKSLHRIIEYKVNKNIKIEPAKKALNEIAKLSNGQWKNESHYSHFVGVANSIIIYNFSIEGNHKNIYDKILEQYRLAYKTVLETANAYYFIAEYIKNGLFNYSRESIAMNKQKKIFRKQKKLNEAEIRLNEFILLTSNFLSVSDEFVVNLNPQGQNVWDTMDKVWSTSKTIKMLQDQLQNSLQITNRVFTQTAKKRQKLTAVIAFATLLFAVVSPEIALWKPESTINAVPKVINFLNANLTAIFVVAAIVTLICFVGFALIKLFKRRKKSGNKKSIMVSTFEL